MDDEALLDTAWIRIYWNETAIAFGFAIHPNTFTLGLYLGPITICVGARD